MRLAVIVLVALVARGVFAQQQSVEALVTLERLLTAISVNADAIDDGDLPLDDVQRLSNEIWNYAAQVPFWAAGRPELEGLLVDLRKSSSALLESAAAQDISNASRHARDVLDESTKLKRGLGLTP